MAFLEYDQINLYVDLLSDIYVPICFKRGIIVKMTRF